jgi:hypothetical protein
VGVGDGGAGVDIIGEGVVDSTLLHGTVEQIGTLCRKHAPTFVPVSDETETPTLKHCAAAPRPKLPSPDWHAASTVVSMIDVSVKKLVQTSGRLVRHSLQRSRLWRQLRTYDPVRASTRLAVKHSAAFAVPRTPRDT